MNKVAATIKVTSKVKEVPAMNKVAATIKVSRKVMEIPAVDRAVPAVRLDKMVAVEDAKLLGNIDDCISVCHNNEEHFINVTIFGINSNKYSIFFDQVIN